MPGETHDGVVQSDEVRVQNGEREVGVSLRTLRQFSVKYPTKKKTVITNSRLVGGFASWSRRPSSSGEVYDRRYVFLVFFINEQISAPLNNPYHSC